MHSSDPAPSVLDDLAWASLTGPHAKLALRSGNAVRYETGIPPFAALSGPQDAALRDLSALVPPGDVVALTTPLSEALTSEWTELPPISLFQMLCEKPIDPPSEAPPELTAADVDDMLALAEATQPGPFGPRSIDMGRFVGVRIAGDLIAMAGERLHPPGHTEISAVCTRAEHRGKGLAEALVRSVAAKIQARGELPFLHVDARTDGNPPAMRLYERLGFRTRRRLEITLLQRKQ